MVLIITKYETATDVVFDNSKFDYYYSENTFPEDTQTDFEDIIDEAGGNFDVIREVDTTDSMGGITSITASTFAITGWITDINKKDFRIHKMGLAVPGNRTIYLKQEYNTSDVVKEGDILVDRKSKQWKIVTILKEPYLNNTEIYKKAIIKSIGLEGSN